MNHAIVIGVETYQDKGIPIVDFGEADASAIDGVFRALGFTTHLLLSQQATKTTIESRVRNIAKLLADDDTVYFFYAGHGFSKSDKNFLTCHDTQRGDLERTSVSVQHIFDALRKSSAKRVILFLDACESGVLADLSVRGVFASLTEAELDSFFADAEFYACFSSCKSDESSFPYGAKSHGAWTYHLVQALSGRASLALEGGRVTSISLQNYLAREVPKTVRSVRASLETQTPWACGCMNSEFLVADLRSVLKARQSATQSSSRPVERIILSGARTQRVKSFSGFKRTHHVPNAANETTNSFLSQISAEERQQHVDKIHQRLRKHLQYKRRDLGESETATIQTPDFEYSMQVRLDPDDPSDALWHHEISRITNAESVTSEEFGRVFYDCIDAVRYDFKTAMDVGDLIDHIEREDRDGIKIDYDSAATMCVVTLTGCQGKLVVTAHSIELTDFGGLPSGLIRGLSAAIGLLARKVPGLVLPK